MKFTPTKLDGVLLVESEKLRDERGFFARTYCQEEFRDQGISFRPDQSSLSQNRKKGTLRGLHYQAEPHPECKLVSCLRGRIYDVVLDVRPASPTFSRWAAFILSPEEGNAVYIPEGLAHGFQTLEDDTWVSYQISGFYHPQSARGIRWNDPAFDVRWEFPTPGCISRKDSEIPDYRK